MVAGVEDQVLLVHILGFKDTPHQNACYHVHQDEDYLAGVVIEPVVYNHNIGSQGCVSVCVSAVGTFSLEHLLSSIGEHVVVGVSESGSTVYSTILIHVNAKLANHQAYD